MADRNLFETQWELDEYEEAFAPELSHNEWSGEVRQRQSSRPGGSYRRPRPSGRQRWPRYPAGVFRSSPVLLDPAPDYPDEQGNEFVRWVQYTLNKLMKLQLAVDGVMRPEVRSAVRDFQRRARLPIDGIIGPDTQRALISARHKAASGAALSRRPRRNGMQSDELDEIGVGEAIGLAGLGLAAFSLGQGIATSGDLSVAADTANYVHANTPAHIAFTQTSIEFKISAHHPRYGIDRQQFYFRLQFEHNGYDLRNVSIAVLRDKSSSLYASTFNIQFRAAQYSQPTEPMTKILYNIQGRWDPVGLGDVSFQGQLILHADGWVGDGRINSEKDWVTWDGFVNGNLRRTSIAAPSRPGLVPPPSSSGTPTLRVGSRGAAVTNLQVRLNRWLTSQGRQQLDVDNSFGSKTAAAVKDFQLAVGLQADGVVGPQTWAVLKKW